MPLSALENKESRKEEKGMGMKGCFKQDGLERPE